MASHKDTQPLAGNNFNTDDFELAQKRKRLHLVRAELGRVRGLAEQTKATSRWLDILERREAAAILEIEKHEERQS